MKVQKETDNPPVYYDAMTGLPNKALFYDRLSQAQAHANRNEQLLAVMFITVDSLKIINDTIGQSYGDKLLRALAERLKSCLRNSDTVARPGRNKFMILLSEITHAEDAALVAKKIFTALTAPFVVEDHELFANTNIGISVYPNDGGDAALIKNSYTAMLHAQKAGKNTYKFYSSTMNDKAFERMMTENGLRFALKRGEFFLHYQPQIDLRTGMISGMEALVRWQRPGFGIVYPSDFIHLMEETGLIVPLGEWVLRNACAQNRAWQKKGLRPVRVAVNLSARQFHQENITEMVRRVLEETGLDPNFLELELTESIFMQNIKMVIDALHALRDMGVHISVDDFGTGYSSLSYLKYFPITKLKIVEPSISAISVDTDDSVIARAIIAMAHSLNMEVIAEGVESEEHLQFLRSLQCDEVQGNIFSHPLPPEKAMKLLSEEKCF